MKIRSIKIYNLASLEGEWNINFDAPPLATAGIFAITGPTGAGKSTILDAICLALFDEIPRNSAVEKVKDEQMMTQRDPRNILRRGATEALAEVVFEGLNHLKYKAIWSVKRANNKPTGKLQDVKRAIWEVATNKCLAEKKTEVSSKVTEITGLDFQQFTRCVLLAQGDFVAFLKATENEKAAILEKLTGIDIYTKISKKIYSEHDALRKDVQVLQEILNKTVVFSDEEINDYKKNIDALERKIIERKKHQANLQKEIDWHKAAQQFIENLQKAQTAFDQANANNAATQTRRQHFNMVEAAQQAAVFFSSLHEFEKNIKDENNLLENHNQDFNKLNIEIKRLTQEKEKAEAKHDLAVKTKTDTEPAFEKAQRLDTTLTERNNSIAKLEQERDKSLNTLEVHHQNIKKVKEELTNLEHDLTQAEQWATEHEQRKPLAENIVFVRGKIGDANNLQENINTLIFEKQKVEENRKKADALLDGLSPQHDKLSNEIKDLEFQYINLLNKLSITDNQNIKNEVSKNADKIGALQEAQNIWNVWQSAKNDLANFVQKEAENDRTLNEKKGKFEEVKAALKEAEIQKNQQQNVFEKAKIMLSENVIALRETLETGEPCPVCGSCEHPAQVEKPVANFLYEIEKEFNKLEKQFNLLNKKHTQLETELKYLDKVKNDITKDITEKNAQCLKSEHDWTQLNIAKPQNLEDLTDWFLTKMEEAKVRRADLQLCEKKETTLYNLKLKQKDLEVQRTKAESSREQLAEQLKSIERECLEKQKSFDDIFADLEKVTNGLPIKESYLKKSKTIAEVLENKAKDWLENTQKLDELKGKISEVKLNLSNEENKASILENELNKKLNDLELLNADYERLTNERKKLLDGNDVVSTRKKMQKAVLEAEAEASKANDYLSKAEKTHALLAQKIENNVLEIKKYNEKLEEKNKKISNFLDNFNQTHHQNLQAHELETLLNTHTREWRVQEAEVLDKLREKETKAQHLFDECQKQLDEHHRSRVTQEEPILTMEELLTTMEALDSAQNTDNEQLGKIKEILNAHEKHKKQFQDDEEKLKTLKASYEDWARLDHLIGSSNGDKFKKIAQRYALDILLYHANYHLGLLARRYELSRTGDSLALQVSDLDMGGEIRSIHSLSGGESFLVSLSLALGLATFSSKRLNIESLFIDEGFGSLDANTLSVVLDALERLQAQGRKIGIISHVQELTERIPVQIQVVKLTNGSSRIITEVV